MIEFLHNYTKDGLRLQATHWLNEKKEICVVFIHGMSGNIIENYFTHVISNKLIQNDVGFIFGHNRGYSHINDIITNDGDCKRIGVTYEIFDECLYDIDLWVKKAKELGYKKIILMGHSLGCNKSIYYLYNCYKKNINNVSGLILASPPDMCGLFKIDKHQTNYSEMLEEAKCNINNNKPRKILNSMLWDWYNISSQTFLSLSKENGNVDNLPLFRNPKVFEQLSKINVPILAFEGSNDDIVIRSIEQDLNLIKLKAISCPSFTSSIIKDSGHTYKNKENEVAGLINDWIKSAFK